MGRFKRQDVATRLWDPARHLETRVDIVAYLDAALEEGDPALLIVALGDIMRALGLSAALAV